MNINLLKQSNRIARRNMQKKNIIYEVIWIEYMLIKIKTNLLMLGKIGRQKGEGAAEDEIVR